MSDPTPAPQGPEWDVEAIRARLDAAGITGSRQPVYDDIATLLAALSAEKEARAAELKTKRPALKSEAHWWYERCIAAEDTRDAALADVERLREALTKIAEEKNHWWEYDEPGQRVGCVYECTGCIAAAALATTPEEPE